MSEFEDGQQTQRGLSSESGAGGGAAGEQQHPLAPIQESPEEEDESSAGGRNNNSIMGKVKKRVSSILPSSLSGWFSPSSKSSADPVFLTNQQPNGCTAQKRKRGRCRIELAADGGAEDSPAGFDVGDAKGLNYEEVALADNIAEHDLAAEDEQTRRSEYSESVFQLRKRLDARRGPYENVDGSEEDVDDEEVEEEEEGDEDDDDDEPNSAMPAHKRRRMEMLETTVTLPNMRRLPLGSSTPAAPVPAIAATESQLLKSRNSSQQRQQGPHRRTRLNQFASQRQREPAYNFLAATEEVPHSIRRSLNIPCSTSSGSQNNSLSSSLLTKIKGRLALNHQGNYAPTERNYEEALLGIGTGEEDQLLGITKSNNNNTNNINNNVIKSSRRVGAIGDSHSESELNEYEENCDNDGLRSSNSNLEFYGNLQSSKSIFNRLNTTAGSQQPARHNSSWSLVSLNRRRRFNASIYGSTSALSDSRLLSRSASAAAASPTASSSSSPFYQGRTTFGGNAANNRVFSQNNLSSSAASSTLAVNSGRSSPAQVLLGGISYGLKPVDMKPSNTDSNQVEEGTAPSANANTQSRNANLSNTTQRILSLLDSYSTPLIDAKRMGSTLREHQSRQRRTPYAMTEANSDSPAPKTPVAELEDLRSNQLLVPTMQQLLERRRLHRVTQTSRDLVRADRNTLSSGQSNAPQPSAGEQAHSQHTNKMRSKISHQTRKQPSEVLEEAPRPLDLPQISFPAMASTPKFDLQFKVSAAPTPTPSSQDPNRRSNFMSRDNLVQAKPAPSSNVTQNGNASSKATPTHPREFSFPTPTQLEAELIAPLRRRNPTRYFQFKPPSGLSEAVQDDSSSDSESSSSSDEVDETVPAKTQSTTPAINGFGDQFKKSASEWECDLCLVRNKSEASKCVACESPKPGAKPAAATMVAMPYPPIVPIASGFGDRFKKSSSAWECDACMLSNKQEATKCVACETPRKTAPPPSNPLVPLSGSGFGAAFKPKANTWECQTCLVMNQSSATECVACQVPNRNVSNSPQGNSSEGVASNSNSNSSSSSSSVSSSTPSVISISSGSSNGGPALKFGAPQPPKADSGFQQLVAKQKAQNWDCDTCMAQNDISRAKCICCEQARPGSAAPATTGSSASTEASAVPKFSFGFGAVKEVPTSKPAVLLAPAAAAAPAPAAFAFGFGQGSAAKDVAGGQKPQEPAKPAFSFGLGKVEQPKAVTFKDDKKEAPAPTPAPVAVPVESNKVAVPAPVAAAEPSPVSQFVFKAPTTSNVTSTATSSAVTATPSLFSFGSPAASSSVVSSSTGTTAAAPPAKPSFSFGTAATSSAASSTTSTSSQPALSFGGFGASAATSAATSTTTTFSANPAPAATSVPKPAPTFNFGKPAVAPGTFFFGQGPPAPAAPAATVPTTVSTGTSMGAIFGISVSTSTSSISSSIVSTSSALTTPTPMVFNFGAEKKSEALATTPSKPFAFGSAAATTSVAPTFGGWPSNGATTSANSMAAPSSVATSVTFGSSMFGVPATSSSPFGSTTTTAAATPAPSFSLGGNGPMHQVFGNVGNSMVNPGATATPAVAAPASANIFGSASATPIGAAAPVFGSGVTSSGFGAAASGTTGTSAPSGAKLAFNFGEAPAAASISGAPFNFGVSSDAPPKPTFNFTGVTASTPQAFNFSASSAAPTMGGGDAQSRVFHFGPSQTAPQTGPLATGGFAAGGFGSANMGMGIGGFGSSTSTSISSVGGGAGVFHFGAPAPQMQMQLQSADRRQTSPELADASQDPHDDASQHAPVEMASQSAAEIATAHACAPAAVGLGGSSGSGSAKTQTETGVNEVVGVTDGREPKPIQDANYARTMVQRLSRRLSERKQQLQVERQQLVHRLQQRMGKYRFVRGASGGSEAKEAKGEEAEAKAQPDELPSSEGAIPPPATPLATTIVTRRMAAHAKTSNSPNCRHRTFVRDRNTKPAVRSEHNPMLSRYKLVRRSKRIEGPPNAEPEHRD
ncbi:nuclear pore complex protein Nup153 isoform X2 [Drosophila bipectinata]|uniref:nuclear pore complex protein Nup153 isoform X2 n=1 Tax=Drosophila bipectinata TaxID=42026 RepID=UPI0038B36ABD